jgi:hypothetical protein
VAGVTLEAAVLATEEPEENARPYLLLRGMYPRLLTPAQVEDLVAIFELSLHETTHAEP